MLLYHFTAPASSHLGAILSEGVIRATDSMLSLDQMAGPWVVWLTDDPDPASQRWTGDVDERARDGETPPPGYRIIEQESRCPITAIVKRLARLTVEVDDAEPWTDFAARHGADPTPSYMTTTAGHTSWWVRERPIQRVEVVALDLLRPIAHNGGSSVAGSFDRAAVRRLFQSAGARRALNLPAAQKTHWWDRAAVA